MKRPLDEIRALQKKHGCQVFYAGDIFDKWNSSAELINFALNHLPYGWAIPGQHDLPEHNQDEIKRSAYWTLVEADKLQMLGEIGDEYIYYYDEYEPSRDNDRKIIVHGFPYGQKIVPITKREKNAIYVSIAHEYIWIPGHTYSEAKAPSEGDLTRRRIKFQDGRIQGYDVMVYGDNHRGFTGLGAGLEHSTEIFNCGTLMRRRSDEVDYRPQVGLLLDTGEIVVHKLDISKDKYLKTIGKNEEEEMDLGRFIEELGKLGDSALDFVTNVKRYILKEKPKKSIQQILFKAMEKKRK